MKDQTQEYADRNGITRKEAKSILFLHSYTMDTEVKKLNEEIRKAGPTGLRDIKTELQRLFGVRREPDSQS